MNKEKEKEPDLAGTRTSSNQNINNESIPQATEKVNTVCYVQILAQLIESITRILPQAKIIYAAASNEDKYVSLDLAGPSGEKYSISVNEEAQ